MSDILVVILGDAVAGTVLRLRGGRLRFDYEDGYRTAENATPLSLSMPLQIRSHPDRVITPWLWGLLPDNQAVLARWGREFHVSASSPFSLLGTPVGEDCPGAVRFVREDRVDLHLQREGGVSWLTEEEVARKLRDLTADSTAWLGRPFSGQFSLAGAQAKTALLHENGRWGVPSGAVPTTHILKPAVAGLDDHDLNEHLCLDAARRSGLLAAKTWVATFDDQSAIVVERYDRIGGENGYVRVHQEDMCQALSVAPSRRYQNEGGPSPESIVASMRSAMPMREADEDVWRFIDALALNWIIGGTDAHAKNYSLLLGGAAFRLAPLYDVASTLPYGLHEKQLRLAMKLGGSYDVFIRRNPWPATAALLQVEREELTERVRALAATLPAALVDSASEPAIATLGRDLPSRLCDVVLHRAARCLEVLDD